MSEKLVNIVIDGYPLQVPSDATILEAAREAGIEIPTLCYLKEINEIGACRMCVVEIEGVGALQASCVYPVREGMVIHTSSPKVRDYRRINLELILSMHDKNCLHCSRHEGCELLDLAGKLNIRDLRYEGEHRHYPLDYGNPSLVRNNNKCILCRRCVAVCKKVQKVEAIDMSQRGIDTHITSAFERMTSDSECILCGQCITVCPTGALRERRSTTKVWDALNNPDLHVVVQIAPAVRVAIGEEFGYPMGTAVTGKMVAATRRLGFKRVFDTNTAADLTIMEEGTELLSRIKNNGTLPMITSCSPGWVKFAEHFFPEYLPNLSTCKSPHTMFGAMIKSYYAKNANIDPKNIFVVSVMPCVAKKYEIERPEMEVDGIRDVDAVITTRELARMIKESNISFDRLKDESFDDPFGIATGAGAIFGATGGVMEAALRTVVEVLSGESQENIEYHEIRGNKGIKEITLTAGGVTLKGAVVSGAGNARELFENAKKNPLDYHFIEVMGCPGGCIMGGGQPLYDTKTRETVNVFEQRAKALYGVDQKSTIRKSHENEVIKKLYQDFLEEPNSETAHHYLHTTYTAKDRYGKTK